MMTMDKIILASAYVVMLIVMAWAVWYSNEAIHKLNLEERRREQLLKQHG